MDVPGARQLFFHKTKAGRVAVLDVIPSKHSIAKSILGAFLQHGLRRLPKAASLLIQQLILNIFKLILNSFSHGFDVKWPEANLGRIHLNSSRGT